MSAIRITDDQLRREPPKHLTVPEAAVYLRQSQRKTWDDVRLGRLPSVKLGGRVILRVADIDEVLARLTRR